MESTPISFTILLAILGVISEPFVLMMISPFSGRLFSGYAEHFHNFWVNEGFTKAIKHKSLYLWINTSWRFFYIEPGSCLKA